MGGKAFEGITRRIKQEEVIPTIDWLQVMWPAARLNGGVLRDHMLGSAGKNETSGDIDLNLRIESYNQEEVAKALTEFLGADHVKARPGNNQIFTAVPIEGDKTKGYVQVDFMFGDYDWQKFSYYSPKVPTPASYNRYFYDTENSQFKGLYRTELIKALVAYQSDWVLEENDEMVARVGPTFFHDKGVVWRYRYRPMRKDGTARIKTLEEVTKEEFLKIFPSAVSARCDMIKDPEAVKNLILEDIFSIDHLQTFESIVSSMRRTYSVDQIKVIAKIYYERLNSLKVDIPDNLQAILRVKVKSCVGLKS